MRPLIAALVLSMPLAAQVPLDQYMPGHDKDFYHQEKAAKKKNEATVEIQGKLDPEMVRQIRFQEFMAWFIPDLHRFLGRYGDVAAPVPEAIKLTQPPPQARVYPMGGATF
ncbi:MAG TPA: hypothetical protein VL181_03230 [Holophagaceae bacterium]|jgi:hypothetical protein|nr:hypothetical protein [Holophagaceae bacterium]